MPVSERDLSILKHIVQTTWEAIEQDIPALKAFCLSVLRGEL